MLRLVDYNNTMTHYASVTNIPRTYNLTVPNASGVDKVIYAVGGFIGNQFGSAPEYTVMVWDCDGNKLGETVTGGEGGLNVNGTDTFYMEVFDEDTSDNCEYHTNGTGVTSEHVWMTQANIKIVME